MRINADLINGYQFSLDSGDLKHMSKGFKSYLVPSSEGLVYSSQDSVKTVLVALQPFCDISGTPFPASKTYTPESKMKALYDHGLTINAEFNAIFTIAEAKMIKPYQWIKSDGAEFHSNHIPQLFQQFNGLSIIGVSGFFDWKRSIFSGALYFGDGVLNESF